MTIWSTSHNASTNVLKSEPVVLVTARWGESHGESGAVIRLMAGALSTRARVEVVALRTDGASQTGVPVRTHRDSVFLVHEVAATRAARTRAELVRAALARTPGDRYPEIAGRRLVELGGGRARGVPELIASLRPRTVVLAGPETWWLPGSLRSLGTHARVVSLPLLGGDPAGDLPQLGSLTTEVDAVGVLSRAERRQVLRLEGDRGRELPAGQPDVVELEVAFAVNRPAAEADLVRMTDFGRYVVLMTGYPDGSPAADHPPGHDYVRRALGSVAVAEVALDRWLISDRDKAVEIPVRPSRPNLWKLLRHAEVCLDLRPQGIVGRETLESLLLGTPVVVPEGTVAAEHAERSNGGLWYRDFRELFDAGKAIVDSESLRAQLGRQGREWAEKVHGDQARFCEQAALFALG